MRAGLQCGCVSGRVPLLAWSPPSCPLTLEPHPTTFQVKPALDAIRALGPVLEDHLQLLLPALNRLIVPGGSGLPMAVQVRHLLLSCDQAVVARLTIAWLAACVLMGPWHAAAGIAVTCWWVSAAALRRPSEESCVRMCAGGDTGGDAGPAAAYAAGGLLLDRAAPAHTPAGRVSHCWAATGSRTCLVAELATTHRRHAFNSCCPAGWLLQPKLPARSWTYACTSMPPPPATRRPSDELRERALDTLCSVALAIGPDFAIFVPTIKKVSARQRMWRE